MHEKHGSQRRSIIMKKHLKNTLENGSKELIVEDFLKSVIVHNDFFKAIECQVRERLPALLKSQLGVSKESIISAIASDQHVEFLWTLLSIDIDNDENSVELLKEIIELWITIRGFSMTSAWLEHYKRVKEKATKRKKGLRKTLAKKL